MTGNYAVEMESSATFQIRVEDASPFACPADSNVLFALERAGRKEIPIGCRRGGCGVCRVKILNGEVVRAKMSRAKVSAADELENYALACCIYPRSDLRVKLAPLGENAQEIRRQEQPARNCQNSETCGGVQKKFARSKG